MLLLRTCLACSEQHELLYCLRIVFFAIVVEELQRPCYNIKSGLYHEEVYRIANLIF